MSYRHQTRSSAHRFSAVICYENNYIFFYIEVCLFVYELLYPVVFPINNRIVLYRVTLG